MNEFRLREEKSLIIVFDETEESENLLQKSLTPGDTGVICMGDFRALKVYRLVKRMGFKIGEDISVIGYFNTPWAEMLSPGLTSVSTQEEEIAHNVALAVSKNWSGKKVTVRPVLVVRESTKKMKER